MLHSFKTVHFAQTCLYTVKHVHKGHLWQKKVAVVERFKQDSMLALSAKKLAVGEKWPLVDVRLHFGLLVLFT